MDDGTEKAQQAAPKPPASVAPAAAAPPRRDKFASMAAKQQEIKTGGRDKFASMAAQHEAAQQPGATAPRRGKFAKLAAAKQASSTTTTTTAKETETQKVILQTKMNQQRAVLKDLEKAEGLTWKLLTLASDTCRALQDLDFDPTVVSKTSAEYRETLQTIHTTLTPHARLVVPYGNHQSDTIKSDENENKEEHNMYAARVEMRLATERQQVLAELLRLEREEEGINKTTAATIDTTTTTTAAVAVSEDSRKRQREE